MSVRIRPSSCSCIAATALFIVLPCVAASVPVRVEPANDVQEFPWTITLGPGKELVFDSGSHHRVYGPGEPLTCTWDGSVFAIDEVPMELSGNTPTHDLTPFEEKLGHLDFIKREVNERCQAGMDSSSAWYAAIDAFGDVSLAIEYATRIAYRRHLESGEPFDAFVESFPRELAASDVVDSCRVEDRDEGRIVYLWLHGRTWPNHYPLPGKLLPRYADLKGKRTHVPIHSLITLLRLLESDLEWPVRVRVAKGSVRPEVDPALAPPTAVR